MFSRSLEDLGTILWIGLIFGLFVFIADSLNGAERELRVCADPNNLPFSNERRDGFENKIAELLARDRGATLNYTWWAQRRGFVRSTVREGLCDVVMGVPVGFDPLLTTKPYYRSTYVFVSRLDRHLNLTSLNDPRLAQLRIGVHLIGNDGFNVPPAHALARRGIVTNIVGYTIYGDYREPNPPARLIEAVANGDVDTAIVWGPLAGYFLGREAAALEMAPVSPAVDPPALRYVFAIAMGVRKDNTALRDDLDNFIERRRDEIQAILKNYGVPQVEAPS
jgi:mxaJ protein